MAGWAPCSNLGSGQRSRLGNLVLAGARFQEADSTLSASPGCLMLDAPEPRRTLRAPDGGRTVMATRCTWAGRVCTTTGETRRFAIDFEDLEELTDNGESLTGTPLVEAIDPASGVTVSGAAIDGTAVGFDSEATKVGTWTIRVTVDTTGGATLVRTMTVEVEAQ